jgi:hypothetical protein
MFSYFLVRIIYKLRHNTNHPVDSVVILSDLRLPVLCAALQISKRHCNSYVLFSSYIVLCNEYGSESIALWKAFKLAVVCLLFKALIVDKKIETNSISVNGIYSSLASASYNHQASPSSHPSLWKNFKDLSDSSQALCEVFIEKGVREVFLYNGRLASVRPVADFCYSNGLKCWYLEYGNVPFHFTIQHYPVHDYMSQAKHIIIAVESNLYLPSSYEINSFTDNFFALLVDNRFSGTEDLTNIFDSCIILSSPHETMYAYRHDNIDDYNFCKNFLLERGQNQRIAIKMHPNMISDSSWPSLYSSLCQLSKYGHNVSVFTPASDVSAISLIKSSSIVCIPSSSLAIVAECLGKNVITANPMLSKIITYARSSNDSSGHSFLLRKLYAASMLLNQQMYHPFWILFMKLFGPFDALLVRKRHLGLRR